MNSYGTTRAGNSTYAVLHHHRGVQVATDDDELSTSLGRVHRSARRSSELRKGDVPMRSGRAWQVPSPHWRLERRLSYRHQPTTVNHMHA